MQITGKNLEMAKRGIELALGEIHNQIAMCPDVFRHADELVELEAEKEQFNRFLARINKAIEKEQHGQR